MFDGKSILITGGTGSFGKKYVKNLLARHKPARVVIYSRDELKQFDMQQQYNSSRTALLHRRCARPGALVPGDARH